MRNILLLVIVVAITLLAWFLWRPTDEAPKPLEKVATPNAESEAPDGTKPRPVATAPKPSESDVNGNSPDNQRQAVEAETGPTGARVSCIWAGDEVPAVAIPVHAYRIENKSRVGPVASETTDANGVATFASLKLGEHAFRVGRVEARATIAPGVLVDAKLTIVGLGEVRGIVIDDAKQPIAGAHVASEIAGMPQELTTAGDDGRFRVRLMPRGRVWAFQDGYQPCALQKVSNIEDELVLQLSATNGSVHGVVLDPNGRTVANANVAIAEDPGSTSGPSRPHVMLKADARGEFATTQVPRGKLIVYAHSDGFGFGRMDVDASGEDPGRIVVRLRKAASIHGVLLAGETGIVPQARTPIDIHRQRELPGLLAGTSDHLTRFDCLTDNDGRYRITGIPPGRMWIAALGKPHVTHNLFLHEGEDYEWNPDLSRPSGVIRGELQGPTGEPLADWQVVAVRVDLIQMQRQRAVAKTDANGQFALKELAPFPQTLTVSPPDSSKDVAIRKDVQPDAPTFVWQLPGLPSQSGAIIGRVLGSDDQPIANAKLYANSEGLLRRTASSSADEGAFRIDGVLPGTWSVSGQLADYGTFSLGHYQVSANGTVDVGTHRLAAPGAAVVRIIGKDLKPLGVACTLEQLEGGDNKAKKFASDGDAWRSPALPSGRYRLRVRGTNFAPIARDVTIPPGGDLALDIEVIPAATVAIEFVPEDLDGNNWQDFVQLKLLDAGGATICSRTESVAGAPAAIFAIALAPGGYSIEATSPNTAYRSGSAQFVVPADMTDKQHVRVMLAVEK